MFCFGRSFSLFLPAPISVALQQVAVSQIFPIGSRVVAPSRAGCAPTQAYRRYVVGTCSPPRWPSKPRFYFHRRSHPLPRLEHLHRGRMGHTIPENIPRPISFFFGPRAGIESSSVCFFSLCRLRLFPVSVYLRSTPKRVFLFRWCFRGRAASCSTWRRYLPKWGSRPRRSSCSTEPFESIGACLIPASYR